MTELLGTDKILLIGLANDELGYIIPSASGITLRRSPTAARKASMAKKIAAAR